jgi:WS/DGAT/MGAT family acyltransferase
MRTHASVAVDLPAWSDLVREILNRHPVVGLAVGVLREGRTETITHGHADLASGAPVTEHTVFRIASITKTMTAIAVMQLWQEGLIDLDAPASGYLRAYRLVLRDTGFRQPTIRHLLTHTAGIPDARHVRDLLHLAWGPWDARPPIFSVPFGHQLPSLGDYYRDGLEVVAEPGSAFAYSNPTFATLGQIVEDVSGLTLDRYLREQVFQPLGMVDTDLLRTPALAARLAAGYACGSRGPRPVPDRDWIGAGGGGVYSTLRDLAGYAEALMHGGANRHGRVLKEETLAQMFERQYEKSPELPALGLAFFRTDVGGHRILSHDGILPGFNSHLVVAPDDDAALIALTNGSSGAMRWLPSEMDRLLRTLLGVPTQKPIVDVALQPETWEQICGRYVLPEPGDLRGRLAMGGGLEVFLRGGRPMIRLRMPIPSLWRGLPLQATDANDPHAYRVDLPAFDMGEVRLRFGVDPGSGRKVMHTDLGGQPITFVEWQPARKEPVSIDRLGTEDQLMLRMSHTWPQDIGALAILDGTGLFDDRGRFRLDAVRRVVASRLHLVPRLRQVIRTPRRGRGDPYWADAQAFDLNRHVREHRLQAPAGEAGLLDAVEALRARRFERRHPLWAMWFLTGLPDAKVAMFVKLHHTIGDGLAAMTIISTFLDYAPDVASPAPPPWVPRPALRPSQLVADNLHRRLSSIWGAVRVLARPVPLFRTLRTEWPSLHELLAEAPGDRTSIDRIVGGGRRLALVRTSYRTVRRIGRAEGASVNDVLLATTGAGVRRLLMSRGERVAGTSVRTYVPVTLRHRLRGPQHGNELAQMAVPLALDEAGPMDRLQRVAIETRRRKARRRPSLGSVFRGRLIAGILLKLVIAQRVNLTTASIPGPRRPAYFAGSRVLEVFPVLPLVGNEPIGVGAVSYADTFNIGIAVDRDAVPDLDALAGGVRDELAALAVAADVEPR